MLQKPTDFFFYKKKWSSGQKINPKGWKEQKKAAARRKKLLPTEITRFFFWFFDRKIPGLKTRFKQKRNCGLIFFRRNSVCAAGMFDSVWEDIWWHNTKRLCIADSGLGTSDVHLQCWTKVRPSLCFLQSIEWAVEWWVMGKNFQNPDPRQPSRGLEST